VACLLCSKFRVKLVVTLFVSRIACGMRHGSMSSDLLLLLVRPLQAYRREFC
jgi:hypothetical protein